MKTEILYFLAFLLFFFSCKKEQPNEEVEEVIETLANNMEDLVVPDGFNYSTVQDVSVELTLIDSIGNEESFVEIKIIGMTNSESHGSIFSGLSKEDGTFKVDLKIPNHYTDVVVQTSKGGYVRSFSFPVAAYINAELEVNGPNLTSVDDRGNNCYPSVNGIFSTDNKRVGLSCSEAINAVKLGFLGGTSETVNNPGNYRYFSNLTPEICNDGIDNDGDGLIDCSDPQCGIDQAYCNGGLPCISSFFQIVGKTLKQLDPSTGQYSHIGDLPNSFDVYNGGGYNMEDGYIYCTGKINSTGKVYLVRMYSNANVTNLGELTGFAGRSYTGDMDDSGNWTNFYYADGTWHMSTVDVSASPPSFVTTAGVDNGAGNPNFYDWVYNAVCDKFYTITQHGNNLLVADHKANPPTVSSIASYSGLPNGAYGAAWSDESGDLYFSNNNTGNIYKVDLDGSCNSTSITLVMTGASTSNNDGMSCPFSPTIDFGAAESDGDGITDQAELASGTNPTDACNPLYDAATCSGALAFSFVGQGSANQNISYVKLTYKCDAPDSHSIITNDNLDSDVDNDGVANTSDPDPLDPNKTFVQYVPSQNTYGTYAFEDLWPRTGDYDFNDFVVQVRENIVTNSSNAIYEVTYDLKIMAMGGIFNNNFGITVPDPNNVATVDVISPHNTTHQTFQRDGKEVIIIQKPKQLFYSTDLINSDPADPYFEPIELQVKVSLDGSYSYPAGYGATFFIEQHGIPGHEIHMPSVAPTSGADNSLFGTGDDDTNPSGNKYYMTPTNLPWGLYVPTEWEYPVEGEEILDAYLDFDDFAQSNPALPWYQSSGNNTVSSKIYDQH